MMDLFTLDDTVATWESALPRLHGDARLPVLQALAWHLRQRDTPRALELAAETRAMLPDAALPAPERAALEARLQLVHAEAQWLGGELAPALAQASAVLQRFTQLADATGCADSYWLLAWIAVDQGDHGAGDTAFAACAEQARRAGDLLRCALAEAALARWAV
ncbi:MAG: GGDEF domain-containing protein, partial [Telluria sp.]